MNDSVNELNYFLVWPLPETAIGVLRNCLVGALPSTHDVIRPSPLCGVNILPATRPPAVVTVKKTKKKRYGGCLAHAVKGVFYSVVANRRQPNLYILGIYL